MKIKLKYYKMQFTFETKINKIKNKNKTDRHMNW